MTYRPILILAGALLLAAAAGAQSVKVEHDKAADFTSYTSYAWSQAPKPKGKETNPRYEGWEKQMVLLIEPELKTRKLTVAPEGEATLILARTLEVKDKVAEVPGNAPGSGGRSAGRRGTPYREVTFRLEMVDAKTGKSVWKGRVVTEFEQAEQDLGERLQLAAQKLLKKYPPEKN